MRRPRNREDDRSASTGLTYLRIAGRVYDEVAPSLFIGPAPSEPGVLAPHFDAVLDCRESADDSGLYQRLGIDYRRLPFGDDGPPPSVSRLDTALAWIENQLADGKRCLIHCRAGVNRGPFVACAYLLPEFEGDVDQTVKHLKRCRHDIRINPVLLNSLRRQTNTR